MVLHFHDSKIDPNFTLFNKKLYTFWRKLKLLFDKLIH